MPASFRPWVCFAPSGQGESATEMARPGFFDKFVMEGFRPPDRGDQEP